VLDSHGSKVGVVGQASRLFVNGLKASDVITVQWGSKAAESCQINVNLQPLPKHQHQSDLEKLEVPCVTDMEATSTSLSGEGAGQPTNVPDAHAKISQVQ